MNTPIIITALGISLILPHGGGSAVQPSDAQTTADHSAAVNEAPTNFRTLDSATFDDHHTENIFIIRAAESGTYGEDLACILTASLLRVGGKGYQTIWKWRDTTQDPFTTLTYESGNFRILDVDGDGRLEVVFWCRKNHDGLDPDSVKLLLFSQGKKYGIRAAIPKEPETLEQYNVLPDKTMGAAPPAIREYLFAEWNRLVGPEIAELREEAESD